jgi:hypothetical protein
MSTAYVAEELGSEAVGLARPLLERLQAEPEPIVRVYVAGALAALEDRSRDILEVLRREFSSEGDEQPKTHLAGALVRLNSPDAEPQAWQWLLDSLKAFPPDPPSAVDDRSDFWLRRREAVRHVRKTRGKEAVLLPLLTKLRDDARTPQWVMEQQIVPAVEEMRRRAETAASP